MKKILKYFYSVLFFLGLVLVGWKLAYGGDNTLYGTGAGGSLLTSGTDNVLIGDYAGQRLQRGKGNTLIGMFTGNYGFGTTGTVKLGYMAGYSDSSSNKLFINTSYYPTKGIFGDFSTGYFGVNTSSPTTAWTVSGTATQDTTASARFLASINGAATDAVFGRSTDKDTGIYFYANTGNRIGITAKGSQVALLDSAGVGVITGTAAAPSLHNLNDRDTGLYWLTATGNRLGITAKGAAVSIFDSSGTAITGNLTVSGTLTPQAYNSPVQALLADSTLTAYRSGYTYIARPVAAKTTATLPAEVSGVNFIFFVADADSLIIAVAGTDSLIDNTGAAYVKTSSVAGSVKVVGAGTGKWFMFPFVGTWTSY